MSDKKKSRTFRTTDAEWDEITQAAVSMGFGENGRGKAIIKLAKDQNARDAAKPDDH